MTYDLAGTKHAIQDTRSRVADITPYLDAIAALPTGEHSSDSNAQAAEGWNPFHGLAAAQTAIQNAQAHAAAFKSSVVDMVHAFPMIMSVVVSDETNGLIGELNSADAVLQALQHLLQLGDLGDLGFEQGFFSI